MPRYTTPTALKVLKGETRPSQLNPREPQLGTTEPECPTTLSPGARPYWDNVVKTLRPGRVLSPADRDAVAVYAECCLSHMEMTAQLREEGYKVPTSSDHGAAMVRNVLVGMIATEAALIRQYARELGLTPSSRTGIKSGPDEVDDRESLLS